MFRFYKYLAGVLFLSVVLFGTADTYALKQLTAPPREYAYINTISVGVNGIYKNGLWTPVAIQCVYPLPEGKKIGDEINENFHIVLSSVDSDGVPIEYRFDVSNPKVEKIDGNTVFYRHECYAKFGRSNEPLKVALQDGSGNLLAERTFYPFSHSAASTKSEVFSAPVPNERPVYLIIGNEDIGLQSAVAELSLREDRRPLLVKVNSVADLPTQRYGYEAVDTIVITTTEPEQFAGLTSESPQIKAIQQWLLLGGRVLFCAGKNAGELIEKEDAPLRYFLPGKYERMTDMRTSSILEMFCESKRQIFMNGTDEAPYLNMPFFSEPEGIVFLKDRDLPLVSRCARGFGLIIYFGGDLSGRPLSVWRDRTTLVRNIMQWNTEKTSAVRSSGSLLQLGYNDISGQIRSALDKFYGIKILPFSIILIILAVYFLAVGPADWFLVHRVLKKPVLTWVTFPLWIILFALLAYFLGMAHRPNKTYFNELTLLDYDSTTNTSRCSTWTGLYSPKDKLFDLTAPSISGSSLIYNYVPKSNMLISWNGLPGSGLGGMSPKTVTPNVWTTKAYQQFYKNDDTGGLTADTIRSMPVQVRSTKSLFSQSWQFDKTAEETADSRRQTADRIGFTASLADEEGIPVGTLTLLAGYPEMDNVMLVYGRWVLELGTVKSGVIVEVGKKTKRRELRDLLIQPSVLEDQRLQQFAAYNMQSSDLDYIARVFSFHALLGGFDSTGLHHSYQRNLDMSSIFSADRAVVIGTIKPVKSFNPSFNEELNRHVVFRQAVPLKLTELSPRLGRSGSGMSDKDDPLADPKQTIGGQGSYEDPSKKK